MSKNKEKQGLNSVHSSILE